MRAARNAHFDQGDLTGYWEGVAADRYSAAREKQDAAFEAAAAMCDVVHENLLALSETGRAFYAEIGTAVTEFLTGFGAALAKIATVWVRRSVSPTPSTWWPSTCSSWRRF
ncbi:hypothetical protein BJF90_07210 [Pseudonocardia sp. CNS-004]|nr:hypothetical protein BJF90_07210 [Pseudonocardia sp. CNS-004]